jgi:CubicO group peptidase (beta-lactamase class C family)
MFIQSKLSWQAATSVVAVCLVSLAALGQEPAKTALPEDKSSPSEKSPAAAVTTPLHTGKVSDPADLEAFFDGVINVQLESKHVAGAVVAVVVGDKLVFTKGYGYADVDTRRKVDPEKTMFRIASISKLFTWTAVMQQVEEGKLDLDHDINEYLKDVKIPPTFDKPITLKNLLTHTPGFEDYVIGLFSREPDARPLDEVLRTQLPKRIRPPGVLASYSNHGTAMAGYAVACVSGMPWEDYIEKRILKPLAMEHTLVRQPAKDKLPADLSVGYRWEHGKFAPQGFEYVPAAPAGCMATTAADAAKFMIAHLNDGQGTAGRILKPETARRMREPLFQHDPKVSAMCYGFMEERHNGHRMVGHGGDTIWFHSLMQLLPDDHVGVFVSYNTDTSGGGPREQLMDAFMTRYFPAPEPAKPVAASEAHEHARKLAGEYVMTRYSHSTVTKLSALLNVIDVSANDDDTLTIGVRDSATRYTEVEPFVYREVNGPKTVVFKEDKDGRTFDLFLGNAPPVSAVRREWYDSSAAHWSLLGASMGVFASALLFWPAIGFSVRGLQSPRIKRTWFSAILSCFAWLLSAAAVAFGVAMAYTMKDPSEIAFGLPPVLKHLMSLTPVCAGLAAVTLIGCLIAWRQRYWRLTGRLHYTLVALAGIGFTWFLFNWNLLEITIPKV